MMNTDLVLKSLNEIGYGKVLGLFSSEEVKEIKCRIAKYVDNHKQGVAFEEDGKTIRGIHGLHLYDQFFEELCCNKKLLELAQGYIGEPVYVHQLKINVKRNGVGQSWPWHEDYIFWHEKDGIQAPSLLNISIFLDNVIEENGPLCFIPGSHKIKELTDVIVNEEEWQRDVSNKLTYQISARKANALVAKNGKEVVCGEIGDVLFFDPRVAHCSSMNRSSEDRSILIVTYNAVSNPARSGGKVQRPEFLSARQAKPIEVATSG